jgi:hypothetical protein
MDGRFALAVTADTLTLAWVVVLMIRIQAFLRRRGQRVDLHVLQMAVLHDRPCLATPAIGCGPAQIGS